jgi:hypothetical protein
MMNISVKEKITLTEKQEKDRNNEEVFFCDHDKRHPLQRTGSVIAQVMGFSIRL